MNYIDDLDTVDYITKPREHQENCNVNVFLLYVPKHFRKYQIH